ncbi:hypothetical protein GCM10018790_49880 [Kitasatospora xanthocidica]|uniref:PD40 domain-containing protein n=1 Tax=Kitasatospora xanthocidica TaxID=83382 RepID=UPI00167508C3|nr:PD40 domain-containing protein [Kitasatospora xanthocidica]GHF66044.1 hypothetical protein GCM10018790_49880 [Kitasatospora xanthocidica]
MTTAHTRRRLARTACVLALVTAAGATVPAAEARPPKGDTARVSEGFKDEQLDGYSSTLGLSADGRSALFLSEASNLLPGAHNTDEVYVRDLRNGHIERVSVADDGSPLNAATTDASISGNGRYVAFSTPATNAVPGQPEHNTDIFVRDRWTGRTELVSAGDGSSGAGDDQTIRDAYNPTLSWDGRYVAYSSNRTDLAPGVKRGKLNVYVTDRWTRTTRLVTVGADGSGADNNSFSPTISADGTTVGFTSRAGNLLPSDPASDPATTTAATDAELTGPRFYPYYVWKAGTGKITGASLDPAAGDLRGTGSDGRISPDGRYAVYSLPVHGGGTPPRNIRMDLYVHELATGRITKVNTDLPGTATKRSSFDGTMTFDDRWVYFASDAETLVPGDTNDTTDVFRRDLWTGLIERVSVTEDGAQSSAGSYRPSIDATGATVVFDAEDGNLVPGDTNTFTDVFRRRL